MSVPLLHAPTQFPSASAERAVAGPRIGCVLDPWTFQLLRSDARLLPLTPENWRDVVAHGELDLLLVSAAWESAEGGWENILLDGAAGNVLPEILALAGRQGVPTAFWHTDEAFHADLFAASASRFDAVFALTEDAVAAYERAAPGLKAHLLPQAIQPRLAHPFRASGTARVGRAVWDGWAALVQGAVPYDALRAFAADRLDIVETRYEIYASKLATTPDYKDYIRGMMDRRALLGSLRNIAAEVFLEPALISRETRDLRIMEAIACGAAVYVEGEAPVGPAAAAAPVRQDDLKALAGDLDVLAHGDGTHGVARRRAWRDVTLGNTAADRLASMFDVLGLPAPSVRPLGILAAVDDLAAAERLTALVREAALPRTPELIVRLPRRTEEAPSAGVRAMGPGRALPAHLAVGDMIVLAPGREATADHLRDLAAAALSRVARTAVAGAGVASQAALTVGGVEVPPACAVLVAGSALDTAALDALSGGRNPFDGRRDLGPVALVS